MTTGHRPQNYLTAPLCDRSQRRYGPSAEHLPPTPRCRAAAPPRRPVAHHGTRKKSCAKHPVASGPVTRLQSARSTTCSYALRLRLRLRTLPPCEGGMPVARALRALLAALCLASQCSAVAPPCDGVRIGISPDPHVWTLPTLSPCSMLCGHGMVLGNVWNSNIMAHL
ncbi:hypothetical protein RR46_03010 [Papilio xuthus]|uniref:Uncharacterized protein n=1 Tax=Papilio xuthus TaxID=66420 RepID=A0A194Q3V6_PAPXU|nr:hypothetical protein RR46_03010 [Papilio xuthus]